MAKRSWLYQTFHTVLKGDLRDFPGVILLYAVFTSSSDFAPDSYMMGSPLPVERAMRAQRKLYLSHVRPGRGIVMEDFIQEVTFHNEGMQRDNSRQSGQDKQMPGGYENIHALGWEAGGKVVAEMKQEKWADDHAPLFRHYWVGYPFVSRSLGLWFSTRGGSTLKGHLAVSRDVCFS